MARQMREHQSRLFIVLTAPYFNRILCFTLSNYPKTTINCLSNYSKLIHINSSFVYKKSKNNKIYIFS